MAVILVGVTVREFSDPSHLLRFFTIWMGHNNNIPSNFDVQHPFGGTSPLISTYTPYNLCLKDRVDY